MRKFLEGLVSLLVGATVGTVIGCTIVLFEVITSDAVMIVTEDAFEAREFQGMCLDSRRVLSMKYDGEFMTLTCESE